MPDGGTISAFDLPYELRRHQGLAIYRGCAEVPCLACQAANMIERQRRIIEKLIDAWPDKDGIPVELLDGRE